MSDEKLNWIPLFEGFEVRTPTEIGAVRAAIEALPNLTEATRSLALELLPAAGKSAKGVSSDPDLEGVEIGTTHQGPQKAKQWSYQAMGLDIAEKRRVADLRAVHKKDTLPEIYAEGFITHEGVEALSGFAGGVFAETVTKSRKGSELKTTEETLEFLDYLTVSERWNLAQEIIRRQTLRRKHFFRSQGHGHVET